MRILSPSTLSNFTRAVVQKDPDETASICKRLFDVDEPMNYQDAALRESFGCYLELKKLLEMYRTFPPSPLLIGAVHFAAATGSMEELKKIEHPSLLNMVDQKGLTPLHYAILHKQKEAIVYLAKRCDLSYLNPVGDSYLHVAALQGDRELLNFFLNLKLDPNLKNQLGMTPGHFWALASSDLTGLKRLYQAGARLDECNELLPLTAVQIHILKVLEANLDPLTTADIKLLAMNAIRIALAGVLLMPKELGCYTNFISFWGLMAFREIAGLFQQAVVETMVPQNLSLLKQTVGIKGVLQARLSSFMSGGQIPDGVLAGSTTATVASHAFSRLAGSTYAKVGDRLFAGGVHLLNLGASLLDCYFAYKPFNEFATLWTQDRIQSSRLTNGLDQDPMKLDPSQRLRIANNAATLLNPSSSYESVRRELDQVKAKTTVAFKAEHRGKLTQEQEDQLEREIGDNQYKHLSTLLQSQSDQIGLEINLPQHKEMLDTDGLFFKVEEARTFLTRSFFPTSVIRPAHVPTYEELKEMSDVERLNYIDLQCTSTWDSPHNQAVKEREDKLCPAKALALISPQLSAPPPASELETSYAALVEKVSKPATAPSNLEGAKLVKWIATEERDRNHALTVAKAARALLQF